MAGTDQTLDLSLLPSPQAIEPATFEQILGERMQDFKARAAQVGIDYDVDTLETDPIKIDQETHAYREQLMLARVNDGIRSVLPAYATGNDLDHVVARAKVLRDVRYDGDGKVVYRESDAALLRRYMASFAMPSAGSEEGYIGRALNAWPQAADVRVVKATAGKVLVFVTGANGQVAPIDAIFDIAKALDGKDARPLTDDVTVSAATIAPYAFTAKLLIPRGPDPAAILAAARASVEAFGKSRYRIGAEVPSVALQSAAYVPNVLRVEPSTQIADIAAVDNVAPFLTAVNLTYEVQA